MWRYLKAAFLARVDVPLLGGLPVNLLAMAGVAVLGLLHPAVWLAGLGLETAYLFLLSGSPRFQAIVDAEELSEQRGDAPVTRRGGRDLQRLVDGLGAAERQQLSALRGKLDKIVALYEQFQVDSFAFENNRSSLTALLSHYARLLVARTSILRHWSADPEQLRQEIAEIEGELDRPAASNELRDSRLRTLEILRVRLLNQEKKETVLAELDSECRRIEQQFDLALENAAIGSKPLAVSAETLFDPTDLGGDLDPPPVISPSRTAARRKHRVAE